jgi:hypothetical protein
MNGYVYGGRKQGTTRMTAAALEAIGRLLEDHDIPGMGTLQTEMQESSQIVSFHRQRLATADSSTEAPHRPLYRLATHVMPIPRDE